VHEPLQLDGLRADTDPEVLIARARAVGVDDADLPRTSVLARRRIVLDGGWNFRDLGGYPTTDGRTTAWGRVMRSDHLNGLTDRDLELIGRIGLRTVHDFRLAKERERQPSRAWEPAPAIRLLNVGDAGTDEAAVDVVMDILSGRIPLPPRTYWDDGYLDMVERARPMFVAMISALSIPEDLPSLFHCTGGKDRTGISAALLLELLGVSRDVAMDDFLATNVFRTPARAVALQDQLAGIGIAVRDALPILGVTRSALTAAWRRIDDEFGGTLPYLVGGGMDPAVPGQLRELLVVPPR
jgi:protein-tyrosine phosphatase